MADRSRRRRWRAARNVPILLALGASLLLGACGPTSPFRSRPAPPTQAPTPTAISSGTLQSVAPAVAGLPAATSMLIERGWRGFAAVMGKQETYRLTRDDQKYTGTGIVSAVTRRSLTREESREISIPLNEMERFLDRLANVLVAERPSNVPTEASRSVLRSL